jgi:hypothetical protein
MGVRASLRALQLILRVLKLTTMEVSNGYYISNLK